MAQTPVSAGNVPPPPRNSPRTPPSNASATSVVYRGRDGDWTWRCEHCGRLRFFGAQAIVEERTRIWHSRRNPYAWCDNCGLTASWNHIASEIQVNRALRAPHEYLDADVAERFSRLRIRDISHALRVFGPRRVVGLQILAREWMEFPRSFTYHSTQGPRPRRLPKRLVREI